VKHLSGDPLLGWFLALLTNARLGWIGLPGKKHSSLLQIFVNHGRKTFYGIGTRLRAIPGCVGEGASGWRAAYDVGPVPDLNKKGLN
jgi:hypothetical protein